MRIYLIGYMGSGKTTLGHKLADRLGISFIDMDQYIEQRYFKSVANIFKEEGEMAFREKEHGCLLEISELEDIIVATGGGAPCFFNNMEVMNSTGKSVFLNVMPEVLVSRLNNSYTARPLIQEKKDAELLAHINEMLRKRLPFYQKASYQITGDNISVDDILRKLDQDVR